MRTITIEYNGCKMTLRERLGRDVINIPYLYDCVVGYQVIRDYPDKSMDEQKALRTSYYEGLWWSELYHVCHMILQVESVEGDLPEGIKLLGNHPSDQTIIAAYESVLNAPDDFALLWRNAILTLEHPIPLASPDVPSKKTKPSAGG